MLYETVREAMEQFFGDYKRRIAHALEVASHALRIQASEGGHQDIVTMTSFLHDVGIKLADRSQGSGHVRHLPITGKGELVP